MSLSVTAPNYSESLTQQFNPLTGNFEYYQLQSTNYQSALGIMYNIMSPNDVRSWLEIMPQIIHVHGKFYGFDAEGNEASIDYPALLKVLVEGGYQGYLSSEYEGHMYSEASAFEAVSKHHALCRRVLAAL